MAQNLGANVDAGVGVIGIIAGILVIIQLPAAHQYHETTLSDVVIGILLALFGIKPLAELQR
ncbi:hypothetical protein [Haloterrigena alkaliphila]|uniref:Uncharacterized protein n=1 Tax=Haloterrigena alkaliphila TaxID=2816475 RepID=A0A8A2V8Q5_9EURY|nr:hypothetical protein [Haloterrigena alkaliphila]QSW97821.1 hypothetical protein J0X25_10350 [Haloterrigena alkaliphila]